jgi:chromosomal replication initiation ATPase DnaA
MTPSRQLAFTFPCDPDYAGAAFVVAPCNAEALAWLDRVEEWPACRLAVWGDAGCGKTHLLRRWAESVGADWLVGPELRGLPARPDRPVAVDEADMAGEEESLLHLLNAANDAGQPLLMAARTPPARWVVRLPDLASRLRATVAVAIGPPDDALLRLLLGRLLKDRSLLVPEAVQDWMLLHLPRQPAALREAARLLDRASWEAGRHVTRPMAAQALRPMIDRDDLDETPPAGDEISGSRSREPWDAPPLL